LQKLVATGVKPRLHVLERLFACLRLWNVPEKRTYSTNFGAELKVCALESFGTDLHAAPVSLQGI
jgi:hypothetical protein